MRWSRSRHVSLILLAGASFAAQWTPAQAVVRVVSTVLTDNGDDDGWADTRETRSDGSPASPTSETRTNTAGRLCRHHDPGNDLGRSGATTVRRGSLLPGPSDRTQRRKLGHRLRRRRPRGELRRIGADFARKIATFVADGSSVYSSGKSKPSNDLCVDNGAPGLRAVDGSTFRWRCRTS